MFLSIPSTAYIIDAVPLEEAWESSRVDFIKFICNLHLSGSNILGFRFHNSRGI
ncbi:hypothetical protein D1T48_gp33 [Thermoproteus tenax virus 1]|uniref:Uncharacterized 6.0 kDa protein n=1 Tax=Thermoproteus tenax virus 1 (strain KRA1) TaxID=10480 RepID=YORU_TTV1K|nr:hypothetical protein D1T48_gp33 [Thermoproteus tenax virus 1]P19305.1 RecName: Full=Uncharacterized 6.0 kDa protein [Thermoproteus tenax virus 1 (STRAIN KRA1)]CAA33001.1 unnamed protein product [Thermoproteus tenax virus 1]